MTIKIEDGFARHGQPAGKRDFRPPAATHHSSLREFFFLLPCCLIAILYGILISLRNTFYRLLFQEPVSVKGRVCFVTGSGRGLGREICLELAKNGAILACADINENLNKETVKLVTELGAKVKGYTVNVAITQEVERVAKLVEEELGPVYLVVNNAALVMPRKDPSEEFVRAIFNVNVLGPYWVMKAFLPFLKSRNEGHILNIGSISSLYGFRTLEEYSATKAALRSLTESFRQLLLMENSKVKITILHPSFMNTTEDYTTTFKSRVDFVSMDQVVSDVMLSVKYGCNDFCTPWYMKCLLVFQLLPSEAFDFLKKLLNINVLLLSQSEYEDLPCGQIVRACSREKDVLKKQ